MSGHLPRMNARASNCHRSSPKMTEETAGDKLPTLNLTVRGRQCGTAADTHVPHWSVPCVSTLLLLVQLPLNVPGKAVSDGPSIKVLPLMWET